MFYTIGLFVALTTIGSIRGQNPSNVHEACELLSECFKAGEGYYDIRNDLMAQQAKVNPPVKPTKEVDVCNANVTTMQTELNDLWSEQRKFYGGCVLTQVNHEANQWDHNQKAKYDNAVAVYQNCTAALVDYPSPDTTVPLVTCKCEQGQQISNYSTFCSKKRACCDALASSGICPIYSPLCSNYLFNAERSNITTRQGHLNAGVVQARVKCTQLATATTPPPPPPTTATTHTVIPPANISTTPSAPK